MSHTQFYNKKNWAENYKLDTGLKINSCIMILLMSKNYFYGFTALIL